MPITLIILPLPFILNHDDLVRGVRILGGKRVRPVSSLPLWFWDSKKKKGWGKVNKHRLQPMVACTKPGDGAAVQDCVPDAFR